MELGRDAWCWFSEASMSQDELVPAGASRCEFASAHTERTLRPAGGFEHDRGPLGKAPKPDLEQGPARGLSEETET